MAERTSDAVKSDRVVVIGGGLSGLAAAHRIHERARTLRRPVELTVLEAKERLGGVIWTDRFDGFTLEGGPDSFITNKPWGIDLCHRLGLSDQLVETDASHRRSFVVRNGRLVPVPEGFVLMAPHRLVPILTTPILSWRGKLRFLMDLVIPAPRRRGRGEPGGLRPSPAGSRGTGPAGSAAGRGHLHGRSQRPEPEGDLAAVSGDGARTWQPDPGRLARVAPPRRPRPRAASIGGAVRDVRHAGRRHGYASQGPGAGAPAGDGVAPARPCAGSAATSRFLPGWSSFWTDRRSKPTP